MWWLGAGGRVGWVLAMQIDVPVALALVDAKDRPVAVSGLHANWVLGCEAEPSRGRWTTLACDVHDARFVVRPSSGSADEAEGVMAYVEQRVVGRAVTLSIRRGGGVRLGWTDELRGTGAQQVADEALRGVLMAGLAALDLGVDGAATTVQTRSGALSVPAANGSMGTSLVVMTPVEGGHVTLQGRGVAHPADTADTFQLVLSGDVVPAEGRVHVVVNGAPTAGSSSTWGRAGWPYHLDASLTRVDIDALPAAAPVRLPEAEAL